MIGQIIELIKTRTARQTFTLFFGSVFSKGIALFILLALAHLLDRTDYEMVGMAMTIMWLVFEFTELGMTTTLVRHAPEKIETGHADRAAGLFRLAGTIKLAILAAALVAAWTASRSISEYFMDGRGGESFVMLAVLGGCGLGSIVFLNGIFHSHKQFYKDVLVSVTQNALKGLVLVLLVVLGALTLARVILVYALVPWAAVLLGMLILPGAARRWGRIDWSDVASFRSFWFQYAIIVILTSMENRFGVFLLKRLAPTPGAVADFFLAQQLNMVFMFLLGAYSSVMFSKVSSVKDWSEVIRVQKKSILPLGIFACAIFGLILSAGMVITIFLPAKYLQTVPAARWLFLSTICMILGMPAGMVIMYMKRLFPILLGHLAALILMAGLCFFLIPEYGASGLAASYAAAMAMCNAIYVVSFFVLYGKGVPLDPVESKVEPV